MQQWIAVYSSLLWARKFGDQDISFVAKWLHEFDAENRLEGYHLMSKYSLLATCVVRRLEDRCACTGLRIIQFFQQCSVAYIPTFLAQTAYTQKTFPRKRRTSFLSSPIIQVLQAIASQWERPVFLLPCCKRNCCLRELREAAWNKRTIDHERHIAREWEWEIGRPDFNLSPGCFSLQKLVFTKFLYFFSFLSWHMGFQYDGWTDMANAVKCGFNIFQKLRCVDIDFK